MKYWLLLALVVTAAIATTIEKGLLAGFGALALVVLVFLVWRWTSVGRGQRARDARIADELDPLLRAIAEGKPIEAAEVAEFASRTHLRPSLYWVLESTNRLELFPQELLDSESQAAGYFARWAMHPNEYGEAPAEITSHAFIQPSNDSGEERGVGYWVLRYRMPPQHWAAQEGEQLAVVGPFLPDQEPFAGTVLAFSRGDSVAETDPGVLVDWFVGMIERKFGETL